MRPATISSKTKLPREALKREAPRIQSPLARYAGSQLTCAVCGCPVGARSGGSQAAWAAHLGSRAHKAKVHETKERLTRKREPPPPSLPPPPPKKLKSILKNPIANGSAPDPEPPAPPEPETQEVAEETDVRPATGDDPLPEGFFDDPIMDAKARNIQYKDPVEEEWDKFQKEMKEQTDLSAAIIAGEQEEATTERQIEEIEEQMQKLSKVLDLNRKKEEVAKQKAIEETSPSEEKDVSSEDDGDFEEYLDWRAKKSYR